MAKKDKRLWIDMCAGSELKDTQGETLSVEGADIEELQQGKGRLNDNHGKGFFNSLGRVTEAKKIMKAEDCENDRQKYYWEKIKAPYVYAKGYLYNDEDHPNARAAAAILRNIHREDAPLAMKASVEGGVLSRGLTDPTRLSRTKIHSVALTFTPANNATLVEPLSIDKSCTDWEADKQLIKSVMHLAETNVPSFRHIERHASAHTIHENISKIQELAKSLGIEIEIKGGDPKEIMQKAVMHKVAANIYKINELVKAVSESQVGTKPLTGFDDKIITMGTAKQVQGKNLLGSHALKAKRDPKYLDSMHSQLVDRGIHPDKAKSIIGKIQSHELFTKGEDDMEKGDIIRSAKNAAVAAAMVTGVAHISGDKEHNPAPNTTQEHVEEHNSRTDDPDLMINAKKQGYDERQPNAKKKFKEKYKKKLKKALTAGYGGAGAPTNLTGGGTFQAESLEGKKTKKSETTDGITYVSCDDCGHEQVHMSRQVKCRKCNKNFPLSKLEGLL
jgi:hypothetical protein